jgi:hypothetical protein
MRKAREDSKVRMLACEQRAHVDRWLFDENRGCVEVSKRCLVEFGVEVSESCIYRYQRSERFAREVAKLASAGGNPGDASGTIHGQAMAIMNASALRILQDAESTAKERRMAAEYVRVMIASRREANEVRRLELAQTKLAIQREKMEYDVAAACSMHHIDMQAIANREDLNEEEQLTAVRRTLFGDSAP